MGVRPLCVCSAPADLLLTRAFFTPKEQQQQCHQQHSISCSLHIWLHTSNDLSLLTLTSFMPQIQFSMGKNISSASANNVLSLSADRAWRKTNLCLKLKLVLWLWKPLSAFSKLRQCRSYLTQKDLVLKLKGTNIHTFINKTIQFLVMYQVYNNLWTKDRKSALHRGCWGNALVIDDKHVPKNVLYQS